MKKHHVFTGACVVAALAFGSFLSQAASLPDHIVNGDFSYPSNLSWSNPEAGYISNKEAIWTYVANGRQHTDSIRSGKPIHGFDQSKFGWKSNEPAMNGFPAGVVEIQKAGSQVYAEMVAEDGNYAIYQDIQIEGDTVLYWSLKHAPRGAAYTGGDTMQVKIGVPGSEKVQTAKRTSNNGSGDKVGATMTMIKTSKPNNTKFAPWESYEGRYVVSAGGKQTIRFTFSSGSAGNTSRSGNLIDDVILTRAYPVAFNPNGGSDIGYNPRTNNYAGYFVPGKTVSLSSLTTAKPSRSGYTFLGWSETKLDAVSSYADYTGIKNKLVTSVTIPKETKTVYAVWAVNPIVTFIDRGDVVGTKTTTFGGTVTAPSDPARTGYDFTGWTPVVMAKYYEDAVHEALWTPRIYTLTYDKNNPETALTDGLDITLGRKSQQAPYDSPWGALTTASKRGYVFLGWFTDPEEGIPVTAETVCAGHLTAYAHWRPIEYEIIFEPNAEHAGTDPEVTGSMDSVRLTYDEYRKLPKNMYEKKVSVPSEDEGGETVRKTCVFSGWSTNPESLTPSLADEAGVLNLSYRDGDRITLYAIWDDAPYFHVEAYPDRYFTLEEAQDGVITEEELLKTVVVYDRESRELPRKTADDIRSSGNDVGITLVGYDPEDFTSMTDDGIISVRYKVTDDAGTSCYLNISVWISRNGQFPSVETSYYRSVSDLYSDAGAGDGGLVTESRWRTDSGYESVLRHAMSGDGRKYDLRLTKRQLAKIRRYVDTNGFGNSVSESSLSGFWDTVGE